MLPATKAGPCGLPNVEKAIAATRKASQVDLFEVRLSLATAAWAALMAPDSPLKPHDRARIREARRQFIDATTRERADTPAAESQ